MSAAPSKKTKRRRKKRRAPVDATPAVRTKDAFHLQRLLAVASTVTALGMYLVGTRESVPGMALVLAGLVGLMFCIHRYGRLGEEGAAKRRRRAKA